MTSEVSHIPVMDVRIELIKVGDRTRKDLGDIAALAASIETIGLLQPIGIDPNYRLVFGERRLRAFEALGRNTIPARFVHVLSLLLAEHAENEIRKDFTPSERVAIGRMIEAEIGNRRGQRTDLKSADQGELLAGEPRHHGDEVTGRTDDVAALKAGFESRRSYRDAKAVVEHAEPELIEAMDRGDVAISTAATLTKADPETQRAAAADPKDAIKLAKQASAAKVREIKQIASDDVQRKRQEKEAKREARREENRAIVQSVPALDALNTAKFSTIVIDPPWDWGDEGDQDQLGRARPDYATMSFDQLLALPVGEKADVDCHLYLWITNRSLPKGFALLDAWGFRYITCLTWVKPHFGMGNYFRGQTEQILFGVKGSQPLRRKDAPTVFHAQRGPNGHSSKPIEFYSFVETCSPGPYLEVFSRNAQDGWVTWGQAA